jgi:hypothetical protein
MGLGGIARRLDLWLVMVGEGAREGRGMGRGSLGYWGIFGSDGGGLDGDSVVVQGSDGEVDEVDEVL